MNGRSQPGVFHLALNAQNDAVVPEVQISEACAVSRSPAVPRNPRVSY